jgi:hypothetical protein
MCDIFLSLKDRPGLERRICAALARSGAGFKARLCRGLDRFAGSRFLLFTKIRLCGLLAAPIELAA